MKGRPKVEWKPEPVAVERLIKYFHRNGYVRWMDEERAADRTKYRKGAEVRLVAKTKGELAEIRTSLRRAGFKVSQPFTKANQWRQPVYGIEEVARFLKLVGASLQPAKEQSSASR